MPSRARGIIRIATILFLLAAAPGALAQSLFGHQIPIKLPKGTNGMQPELALAFSPGGGNGLVGVGWQLTGLNAIARVKYGGIDTYAHSQLGMLVRQSDGSYRSKKESFVKLVPYGLCATPTATPTEGHSRGGAGGGALLRAAG